jgi:hypothetical protein
MFNHAQKRSMAEGKSLRLSTANQSGVSIHGDPIRPAMRLEGLMACTRLTRSASYESVMGISPFALAGGLFEEYCTENARLPGYPDELLSATMLRNRAGDEATKSYICLINIPGSPSLPMSLRS